MIPALALLTEVVQLAPALAKLFGGGEKSTEVAELAANVAKTVTGTSDNQSALDALKANPTLFIQYQQALLAQEREFETLYTGDKASARSRDVELAKLGARNYRADALVAVSVLVILVILGVVIAEDSLSEFAKGALTTILGVFLNQLTNVFSFEFGTTRKNEEQTAQITSEYIKS